MRTFLILVILVAPIIAYLILNRGETLRFETTADPKQVIMNALSILGAKRRWTTLSQSDNAANFSYHKKPNGLVALILLCFLVVPGIVYIVLARKKESASVMVTEPTGSGMTIVQIVSNGWRGKSAGRSLRTQIGTATGTAAALTAE